MINYWPFLIQSKLTCSPIKEGENGNFINYWAFTAYLWKVIEGHVSVDCSSCIVDFYEIQMTFKLHVCKIYI